MKRLLLQWGVELFSVFSRYRGAFFFIL